VKNLMLIMALGLLVMFTGCTGKDGEPSPIKTVTADMVGGALSSSIITVLSCENTEMVKKDVGNTVNGWFGLPQNKGLVGSICQMAVSAVVPMLFSGSTLLVKPEWKCTGKATSDLTVKLASMACGMIPI
jgi:hypothetical protein